jgi:hypothetical protein
VNEGVGIVDPLQLAISVRNKVGPIPGDLDHDHRLTGELFVDLALDGC